ncbi:DUF4329 domain-containing protein [Arenimonas composti]|uniref:Uncharacterized protein n=1 Tax=Arenimonas composti TR7-09 = DSM 18010 TaxID=1121013 RepID=A0A091BHW7_9GAMM|nr:DUF4329 domain-containing protein [Arenimonas composti]KFN50369.1 hypothetical protein P873_06765 [Arenimonas composti TR7-09 = DSM 18010]
MKRANLRSTMLLAVAAMFATSLDAAAQSVDIGGQTCSNNYSLYDYFSNGEYIGSAWEVDGVSCTANPGAGFDYDFSAPGSGGGTGPATPACRSTDPAVANTHTDALAVSASTDIKSRPDYRNREYGALIYRDAGGALRMTALVPGTATSVTFSLSQLGVTASSIVGIVHNHPYNVYNTSPQELQINLNPSVGDWNTAAEMVAHGANPNVLQLYVVGTDGALREFDYNNRAAYEPRRTPQGYGVTPGDKVPTNLVATPCP